MIFTMAFIYDIRANLTMLVDLLNTSGDVTDGGDGTEDLVLALPTETENGGINLQLLTYTGGDTFLAAQTLAVGEGFYSGCAGLHAGVGEDGASYVVVDGWT